MDHHDTEGALRARIAELERALEESERHSRKLEEIIDAAPGIMWETEGALGTPEYRTIYVSRQVEQILGYRREEWMQSGAFWLSVIHPDDKPKLMRTAPAIGAAGGKPAEHRFIAKDGREVWAEAYVRVVRDAAGAVVGRAVFVLDVTERRQAQVARTELFERAQALSKRLDDLIASVPGMVWEAQGGAETALSQVSFVSPYLAVMTGYSPEEAVNNPSFWSKLTHPDDKARVSREIREVYESGGGAIKLRWVTKDGRVIWVESHVYVMRDEASLPVSAYGVTMDITARKLAEEAEVRLRDEVINAQAAALAELDAPLIPISAEVLVMPLIGAIDAERASRVIETLLRGIARARARVAILDITGLPSVDAETADALLRAARSVRLLGAEVVLTGVRPEVAQTLVTLGVDLQGIVTRGTLESGIAYATRS